MSDGSTPYVFYNGVPAEEMRGAYGLLKNGMENVKPILTRGIYIDLASYKGVADAAGKIRDHGCRCARRACKTRNERE